jgi:hypothetical protein
VFNLGTPVLYAKVFTSLWSDEKNVSKFFIKLNLFIFNRIVLFSPSGLYLSYFCGVKTFFSL